MSDRGILFLFSVAVIIASLATSGWLIATGQAGSVDGLFLLLTCLLMALAFALYVVFMIGRAMQAVKAPATAQTAKAGTPAPAKTEPVPQA